MELDRRRAGQLLHALDQADDSDDEASKMIGENGNQPKLAR
jgi:hypothetical protein